MGERREKDKGFKYVIRLDFFIVKGEIYVCER